MYSTTSISRPHSFTIAMLCRLFSKPDRTKFSSEWLPLIHAIVSATIMDYTQILLDNLAKAMIEYIRKRISSLRAFPPFFVSAIVMDAIYFSSKFPNMGWKWNVQDPLHIHMYHNILWESQFHPHFYKSR